MLCYLHNNGHDDRIRLGASPHVWGMSAYAIAFRLLYNGNASMKEEKAAKERTERGNHQQKEREKRKGKETKREKAKLQIRIQVT